MRDVCAFCAGAARASHREVDYAVRVTLLGTRASIASRINADASIVASAHAAADIVRNAEQRTHAQAGIVTGVFLSANTIARKRHDFVALAFADTRCTLPGFS